MVDLTTTEEFFMDSTIRTHGRADRFDGLQDYRRRQAEAYLARNSAQLRAAFWARKEQDRIDGERWLAERGLTD